MAAVDDDDDRKPSATAAGDDESDVEMEGEQYCGWLGTGWFDSTIMSHTSLSLPYAQLIIVIVSIPYADLLTPSSVSLKIIQGLTWKMKRRG